MLQSADISLQIHLVQSCKAKWLLETFILGGEVQQTLHVTAAFSYLDDLNKFWEQSNLKGTSAEQVISAVYQELKTKNPLNTAAELNLAQVLQPKTQCLLLRSFRLGLFQAKQSSDTQPTHCLLFRTCGTDLHFWRDGLPSVITTGARAARYLAHELNCCFQMKGPTQTESTLIIIFNYLITLLPPDILIHFSSLSA